MTHSLGYYICESDAFWCILALKSDIYTRVAPETVKVGLECETFCTVESPNNPLPPHFTQFLWKFGQIMRPIFSKSGEVRIPQITNTAKKQLNFSYFKYLWIHGIV